jgi:hypothetical protein
MKTSNTTVRTGRRRWTAGRRLVSLGIIYLIIFVLAAVGQINVCKAPYDIVSLLCSIWFTFGAGTAEMRGLAWIHWRIYPILITYHMVILGLVYSVDCAMARIWEKVPWLRIWLLGVLSILMPFIVLLGLVVILGAGRVDSIVDHFISANHLFGPGW